MKRFCTENRFIPLKVNDDGSFSHIQKKDRTTKDFKTRAACEAYCKKNHCVYCEEKFIFYR